MPVTLPRNLSTSLNQHIIMYPDREPRSCADSLSSEEAMAGLESTQPGIFGEMREKDKEEKDAS